MFKEIICHGKACGERQGGPRRQDLCCIRHYCCQQTCLQLLLSQCCLTWPGESPQDRGWHLCCCQSCRVIDNCQVASFTHSAQHNELLCS